MKRITVLLLILALALTMWACKKENASGEQTTAASTAETTEDVGGPDEGLEGPSLRDQAVMCIDCPVQDLYDAIGLPQKIEYYPSPMDIEENGDLEEGVLTYDGFLVYTLKEGEMETVLNVE